MLTTRTWLRRSGRRPVILAGVLGTVALVMVGALAVATAARVAGTGSGAVVAPSQGAAPTMGTPPIPQSDAAGRAELGSVPIGGATRALLRTAQITVGVADPVATVRRVRAVVVAASGTVAQEESTDRTSRVTLRVPADRLDGVLDEVAALGRVVTRAGQVVDATESVIDLDARVASQRASVDRVRALLAQARSIGEVVAVESELTRREADLDSLTGRLAALRDQVALATLTVDLEREQAGPVVDAPGGFLDGVAAGWGALRALGSAAGVAVGYALPFVPVLALLAGIAWLIRRRVRRGGAARGREGGAATPTPGSARSD